MTGNYLFDPNFEWQRYCIVHQHYTSRVVTALDSSKQNYRIFLFPPNKHFAIKMDPICMSQNVRLDRNNGTVMAPVFGRHQFFGTSEHYTEKPKEVFYLDELIIIILHVAGFLHPVIFNTSITVLTNHVWKFIDCTVQSAEYWCFYGTYRSKYHM